MNGPRQEISEAIGEREFFEPRLYEGDWPFERLVQRGEALPKTETTGRAQAMRAAGAAEKAERKHATGASPHPGRWQR